jgi:hypothetical protein
VGAGAAAGRRAGKVRGAVRAPPPRLALGRLHLTSTARPPHRAHQAPGVDATWTQNTEEVLLRVPVASDVRGRDVAFEAHPKRLSLRVRGEEVVGGGLADAGEVDVDGAVRGGA